MESLVYVYLLLLFGILPLYMQDGLVQIGNVKYLFFRNTTIVIGAFWVIAGVAVLWRQHKGITRKSLKALLFSCKTDIFVWAYLLSGVVSFWGSPDRQAALWGYSGWYMGLVSQVLFVGIYFACSRYYDGSKAVWLVGGMVAGIVTGIGLLNRLDIDVLGVFREMELHDANRLWLISTIGHSNWYVGYISVTIGISMAAACCGKKYISQLGMLGCFLFFASCMTANALTGAASALGLCILLLIVSLKERKKLMRVLQVLMLLPLSNLLVKLLLTFHITGLVLGGEAEAALFFSPMWAWLFFIEAVIYLILYVRERLHKTDLLADGRIMKALQKGSMAVLGILAIGVLLLLMLAGQGALWENGLMEKLSVVSSNRISLWCVTIQTFLQESLSHQLLGNGPDTYYYVMHEWKGNIYGWINSGLLQNDVFTNAHNEWLTMLINQGIFSVLAYAGIFVSGQKAVEDKIWDRPEFFAVYFGIAGYFICSLFTFQHVISTPYVFALLGMAQARLKQLDK